MIVILLDTHVLIWAIQDDDRLGARSRETIDMMAAGESVAFSAFSVWEIAHLDRSGRVPFPGGALTWVSGVLSLPGFQLMPIAPAIAVDSVVMEWSHKDPADRIIVASSRHVGCPLLTADEKILAYAAAGHVNAVDARV